MRGVATGIAVLVVWTATGCGGGSSGGTGGHAGGGSGGQGGVTGGGGAGGSGNLPKCAIVARPADPDGGDPMGATCNSIVLTAPTLMPEPFLNGPDGGVSVDGGPEEGPAGGTILDGDYRLVRFQNNGLASTQRQLRVFGGGTYIEWAVHQSAPTSAVEAGVVELRFDTTGTNANGALTLTLTCGGVSLPNFFYTAAGNALVLFDVGQNNIGRAAVLSVDSFERTCAR